MTSNLTPKQEAFCLKHIESGNATTAYHSAYDVAGSKPITANRAAKALLDNPKIATRVCEPQQAHLDRHMVTVDSITPELDESRKVATADRQRNAAIAATLGKAKIHDLLVEKTEQTGKDGGPVELSGDKAILLCGVVPKPSA